MDQKPWQIILEIVMLSVVASFGLLVLVYVGAGDLGRIGSFLIEPCAGLWQDYDGGGFFRGEGRGYALLVFIGIAVFLLCVSFRLSVWLAKALIAFAFAKAVLSAYGAVQIAPPSTALYASALAGALWIVVAHVLAKLNLRELWQGKPFGSAKWAGWWQLRRAGLTQKGGLFLGRARGRDLYHNTEGHIITIGGAGGGKSTGLVVPALLNLTQGSVIVTDPSGELTAITMRHRAQNGRVVLLNPFQEVFEQGTGLDYPDTGFNPMSIIDPTLSTFKADCDVLARYLMVTDRKESGSYWNDEGAEFLSLVIAGTALYEDPECHNLSFIYEKVRQDLDTLMDWFAYVVEQDNPAIRKEAGRFLGLAERSPINGMGSRQKQHWPQSVMHPQPPWANTSR